MGKQFNNMQTDRYYDDYFDDEDSGYSSNRKIKIHDKSKDRKQIRVALRHLVETGGNVNDIDKEDLDIDGYQI